MNQKFPYRDFTGKTRPGTSQSYVISGSDAQVVDFAIKLERPLLVEGEAGCGKTRLAYAIAQELDLGEPIVLPVKSTSQAKDFLYRFDALRRLQDIQIEANQEKAQWVYEYIELEPLGKAIHEGEQRVILIDEIDKADIDFPNDLLDVLDKFEFTIEDMPAYESGTAEREKSFGREVRPKARKPGTRTAKPIVVITSNREKQLPEPFLRRCLYLELSFPEDKDDLARIVEINLGAKLEEISRELIEKAVEVFLEIRREARRHNAHKLPATAELIDWVHVLHWSAEEPIEGLRPPHWRLLFKSSPDLKEHQRQTASSGSDS